MKLVIINGSLRKGRNSIHVSRYLEQLLKQQSYDVNLLDIKDFNFPVMEERMRFLEEVPPRMPLFSDLLNRADGLLIVSPEYNGSYSGALKNTLDYFKSEYERKSMGLVTVSTGKTGGINAMHHLQAWAIHVKGIVSPYKLLVDQVEEKFASDGVLTDKGFEKVAQKFLKEFIWLSERMAQGAS